MTSRSRATSAIRYLQGAMVLLALVLPTFSLAILGTLWLWQHNALLIWSVIASGTALVIYGVQYWLLRRREQTMARMAAADAREGAAPSTDTARSPREAAALAAVEQIARDVQPETLNNRDAILALGTRTVETVARHMHEGASEPIWNFTVPEALALVSRVSGQLNRFVVDAVPLGDRLTVGQLLAIYRWRGLVGVAEKAYDLYRLLRFVNPAAAIAGELREKVSGQLVGGVRTELMRRIARAYIREVGEAAVDLYSGRLRPEAYFAESTADGTSAVAGKAADTPLEILIVGQAGVGKSSLVNALSNEMQAAVDVVPTADAFTRYALSRDDVPLTILTDSPNLSHDAKRQSELIEQAGRADAIVWLLSAVRPDRAADVEMLKALRAHQAAQPDRRPPPILFALSHVDRVRPFNEWQPPYDLTDTGNGKSGSIRDALAAVAEDLKLGGDDIIPIALDADVPAYNVELLWARLMDIFDDARNVQLLRRLAEAGRTPITKSLWRQAVGAGRVIRSIARQ